VVEVDQPVAGADRERPVHRVVDVPGAGEVVAITALKRRSRPNDDRASQRSPALHSAGPFRAVADLTGSYASGVIILWLTSFGQLRLHVAHPPRAPPRQAGHDAPAMNQGEVAMPRHWKALIILATLIAATLSFGSFASAHADNVTVIHLTTVDVESTLSMWPPPAGRPRSVTPWCSAKTCSATATGWPRCRIRLATEEARDG
jgi:hypothetical protein